MNGLYGYPSSGPMRFGAFGATATALDEKGATSLYGILSGSTYNQLREFSADWQRLASDLDVKASEIERLPVGGTKNKAKELLNLANESLTRQFSKYQQLKAQYNEVVRMISTASFGFATPPTASFAGLGDLGMAPAAIFAGMTLTQIFVAAGLTLGLLWAITDMIGAIKSQGVQTQKYTNQLAQVLSAAGDVAHEGGSFVKDVSAGTLNFAVAAAIGVGVYLLVRFVGKKKSSEASTIDVKPVRVTSVPSFEVA